MVLSEKINKQIKTLPFMKKEKPPKVKGSITDLIPFKRFEGNYIKTKTGLMEILQIETTDILSKNDSEIERFVSSQTGFMRTYLESFKEINLNFPTNCTTQKDYWERKHRQAKSDVQRKFIERKLFEFNFLEENRTNREFFIFIYADTADELKRRIRDFKRLSQSSFPAKSISNQKKTEILYLLNNQNSKIIKE